MTSLGLRHPGQVPRRGGYVGPRRTLAFPWVRSTASGWRPQVLTCYMKSLGVRARVWELPL